MRAWDARIFIWLVVAVIYKGSNANTKATVWLVRNIFPSGAKHDFRGVTDAGNSAFAPMSGVYHTVSYLTLSFSTGRQCIDFGKPAGKTSRLSPLNISFRPFIPSQHLTDFSPVLMHLLLACVVSAAPARLPHLSHLRWVELARHHEFTASSVCHT